MGTTGNFPKKGSLGYSQASRGLRKAICSYHVAVSHYSNIKETLKNTLAGRQRGGSHTSLSLTIGQILRGTSFYLSLEEDFMTFL
jgi:hypothetical protein